MEQGADESNPEAKSTKNMKRKMEQRKILKESIEQKKNAKGAGSTEN